MYWPGSRSVGGWFVLCSIAFGGRILHFGEPVEVAEEIAAARSS
jgi:hypothetical protein